MSGETSSPTETTLARRLGPFDATMIVMGGIIGAGIFVNPSDVARDVHTPALVLGAWVIGGAIALIGAFVYAELAALRPRVGGQYAYLRDAYHPIVAFLYGWTLLLVVQTGGMAGAAIIFGRYFRELTGLGVPEQVVAAATLGDSDARQLPRRARRQQPAERADADEARRDRDADRRRVVSRHAGADDGCARIRRTPAVRVGLATAMVPVLFAYGGWQTASFVSGEMRDPRRDLPRGLLIGVVGVIVLYLAVTYVCLRVLGVDGLAQTHTPASEVMRRALGDRGARLIALGIAVSTVGFLSQSMLTAPRVYYAMARDGVFFSRRRQARTRARACRSSRSCCRACGRRSSRSRASTIRSSTTSRRSTCCSSDSRARRCSIFRARARTSATPTASAARSVRVPGHPITTIVFVLACWAVSRRRP